MENSMTFTGSLMFYMRGVTKVLKGNITSAAKRIHKNTPVRKWAEEHTSAVHYAVFVYLAGCMKSPHNHFLVNSTRYIAVDNDRCFTPEHVMKSKHVPKEWYDLFGAWETLVFEICDFPSSLLETLRDADNSTNKLSDRLRLALAEDPLAAELLAEQPEAFVDMDARALKLLQHMESCQKNKQR